MVTMNLTADLVCINLSGVEMLTDVLFYVLKFSNTYLRMVKKAVFTGNHTTGCFKQPAAQMKKFRKKGSMCVSHNFIKEAKDLIIRLQNNVKQYVVMQYSE